MKQFTDAAGRTAWVDANGMVFTEGGSNPTYYNVNDWNTRQLKRWGTSSSSSSSKTSSKTSTTKVPTAQEYAQAIVDTQNKQIQKEVSFIKDYLAQNPFAFDELLISRVQPQSMNHTTQNF